MLSIEKYLQISNIFIYREIDSPLIPATCYAAICNIDKCLAQEKSRATWRFVQTSHLLDRAPKLANMSIKVPHHFI